MGADQDGTPRPNVAATDDDDDLRQQTHQCASISVPPGALSVLVSISVFVMNRLGLLVLVLLVLLVILLSFCVLLAVDLRLSQLLLPLLLLLLLERLLHLLYRLRRLGVSVSVGVSVSCSVYYTMIDVVLPGDTQRDERIDRLLPDSCPPAAPWRRRGQPHAAGHRRLNLIKSSMAGKPLLPDRRVPSAKTNHHATIQEQFGPSTSDLFSQLGHRRGAEESVVLQARRDHDRSTAEYRW